MSWFNVLNEIRENTKSAQTRSQVNVKYISARNGWSGPPTENPFQTTNLSTKAGPIANTAIIVIRAMRICRVWLRETHFEVVKKRNHCKGYLVWTRMIWALNCPLLLFFKRTNYYRTRVRSLVMLVSNSLTHSLTNCRLVNLIDVSLVCEDGNSKLVEVVDDEKQFTP